MKQSAFCISLLVAVSTFYMVCEALAINRKVANSDYWYCDDDIRNIITNRLGDRVYVAPAVPNNAGLIADVVRAAIIEARAGRPALVPVHSNGNHWTALVIRVRADGTVIGLYNDSFGNSVGGITSETGRYKAEIRRQVANSEFWDLQVRQQNDGSSCGVFATENLITLAELETEGLTRERARAVLEEIKDAESIRLQHLKYLKQGGNHERD